MIAKVTYTLTQTFILALTYTLTHSHTLTHTHTYTLTDTHTNAQAMAGRGEDVRLYHFTQDPAGKFGDINGAFHGSEVPYVFGPESARAVVPISNPELADQMSKFVPNPSLSQIHASLLLLII